MFALKLYAYPRTRIVEAVSFTVYWYDHGTAAQITAHQKDQADDKAFYVGDSAAAQSALLADEIWYGHAIIENAAGKTTEMVKPTPSSASLPPG